MVFAVARFRWCIGWLISLSGEHFRYLLLIFVVGMQLREPFFVFFSMLTFYVSIDIRRNSFIVVLNFVANNTLSRPIRLIGFDVVVEFVSKRFRDGVNCIRWCNRRIIWCLIDELSRCVRRNVRIITTNERIKFYENGGHGWMWNEMSWGEVEQLDDPSTDESYSLSWLVEYKFIRVLVSIDLIVILSHPERHLRQSMTHLVCKMMV